MTPGSAARTGRRARLPQAPLPREIGRGRITAALHGRFDRCVTTLVAGAGFGKTTALAQAIRANLASPLGIDAWVSCETADEDARRLAEAIVAAIGADEPFDDPLDGVLRAIRGSAPVDVCLVIDDVHELPAGSAGLRLLADLLDALPPHAHIVLASRQAVPFRLARRRAAGEVLDLGVDDLAFTPHEVAALARLHRNGTYGMPDVAGWPSLVALSLSTRRDAGVEFLWEEVVADLSAPDRQTLLAMTTLGWGTAADAMAVGGPDVCSSRVARLVQSVPLISSGDGDRFSVHQLWEDANPRIFDDAARADARRRALDLLARQGDALRLGSAALRWDDAEGLLTAALLLVRSTLGALPVDTAERWLSAAGAELRRRPEVRLLALAVDQARRVDRPSDDDELDELIETFRRRPGAAGAAEAIALAAVVAHGRADLVRLAVLAERSRSLPELDDIPLLRFLSGAIDASKLSLDGDAAGSLRLIDTLPFDLVPVQLTELVTRLRATMLMLTGRADDAVVTAAPLAESSSRHVRAIVAYLRWHAGQPFDPAAGRFDLDGLELVNPRDRLVRAAEVAAVASSCGDRRRAAAARRMLAADLDGREDARDSAIGAIATATVHVLEHDELAAEQAMSDHVARFGIDNALGTLHLRRQLAIGYVLSEPLRRLWDAAELGPSHVRARAVARRFLDARQGRLATDEALPDAGAILVSLPLPWSVELAAAACRSGVPGGRALATALTHSSLDATRAELTRLATGDGHRAFDAAALLAELPTEATPALQIDLLGPLRLSIGGQAVTGPELRRGRVRTLLALLAVRGPLRRDQVIDMVWPDADLDSARQNLRTTLTRLRRLLDPDDPPSGYRARLRAEGDQLSLAEPPHVDVDIWRFRRLVDACTAHGGALDSDDLGRLQDAVGLWRGDPAPDLESVAGLDADLERLRSELVDASLLLGEQLLAVGRFDGALDCVARCRPLAPYSERAHRLAIAALLQRRDRDGLAPRIRALREMLDELGVGPEPATSMLLARADEALGAVADVVAT